MSINTKFFQLLRKFIKIEQLCLKLGQFIVQFASGGDGIGSGSVNAGRWRDTSLPGKFKREQQQKNGRKKNEIQQIGNGTQPTGLPAQFCHDGWGYGGGQHFWCLG